MAELQQKAEAWRELITLYTQNNIVPRIQYRVSNSTSILREIAAVRANIATLPRNRRQVRITNNPTRPELYRQLKRINPNNTLNYRQATIQSINREIFREIRNKNQNITQGIISRNLTRFLNNPVNNATYTANPQQFLNNINNINIHGRFLLEMRFNTNGIDTYRILTNTQEVRNMLDRINQGYAITHQEVHGSDADEILDFIQYGETAKLTWFNRDEYHRTNTAAYFKWFHKFQVWNEETRKYELKLDLARYQVYAKSQKIDYEACLVYSLIQLGISSEKINQLRLNVFEKEVSFRNLALVSKQLDLQIELTYHDEKKKQRKIRTYNKESVNIVRLGVVDEHYFVNEMTNITASAITYFNETKNETIYPMVYLKSPRHKVQKCDKFLTSYEVIRNIYNQREKWLVPISIENVNNYEHVEKFESYDKLRAPRKACTCNAIEDNEEIDLSKIENNLGKLAEMPHIYKEGKRPCFCICKKQRFNEYKDYSRRSAKSIFKGKFKEHNDPNNNYDVIFLDLETFFQASKGYHVPYCVGYQFINDDNKYCVYGLESIVEFLNSLKRNAVIITHNLAFDFRGFVDYLTKFQIPIETGTKLKHIQCKYNYNHLVFKDNCAFLPFKLSALPEMFKLKSGDKDVYPYELINETNIDSFIDINTVNEYINKPADRKAFKMNCEKIGAITNQVDGDSIIELVDIKAYTIYYCNQDVSILKQAYLEFRKQILEITKIDIMTLISLPQLADDFFKSKGAYDGCYSISGVSQDFIRKCAIGGRVMTCNNEKWHIKHNSQADKNTETCKRVSDFDAVSLYPSAMKRLDGYLKGLPIVLSEGECLTFTENNFDYYFVEIEILSVGIKRDFPLISIKNKSGIRDFTNNLEGSIFHVDKTTLQDLVKFQNITYRVIRGYKFADGFNNKIVDIIEDMFKERIKLKNMIMPDGSKGNPLQQAYKLILNASYGKLIMKPIKKTKKFYEGNYRNYVIKNAKLIESYQRINDELILLTMKKSIIQHYTACHLACQVLSMSKRIMNEVMCLASDNSIKIFYQDTDSMHLFDKDVKPLAKLFKDKYRRELIGEDMGQFHPDFEVHDNLGEKIKVDRGTSITAIESLFLAKKTYIDKLEYQLNGEIKHDYHIRAKGLPSSVIKQLKCKIKTGNKIIVNKKEVDEYVDKEYNNVMDLYKDLFNDESIEFDLSEACPLKMGKDYRARNTVKFTRNMHCPNDKKNII